MKHILVATRDKACAHVMVCTPRAPSHDFNEGLTTSDNVLHLNSIFQTLPGLSGAARPSGRFADGIFWSQRETKFENLICQASKPVFRLSR